MDSLKILMEGLGMLRVPSRQAFAGYLAHAETHIAAACGRRGQAQQPRPPGHERQKGILEITPGQAAGPARMLDGGSDRRVGRSDHADILELPGIVPVQVLVE